MWNFIKVKCNVTVYNIKYQPLFQMFILLIGVLNHYGSGGVVGVSVDNWVRKMGWLPSPAADAAVSR